MRIRLCWLIANVMVLAALCGCGTPGAPQPPSLQLARPVEDLTATRKGNKVQLAWTLAEKNTDKTLAKHITEVRICRRPGTALMGTCATVAEVPTPNPPARPRKGQPEPPPLKMQYGDVLPPSLGQEEPAGFVTYAVEEMNSHGRSAGLSNQVQIAVAPTIPAPDSLSAQLSADGVRISWEGPTPPSAAPGLTYRYRVERKPQGAPGYTAVEEIEPSARGSYLDKSFAWETHYEYRIATATQVHAQGISTEVEGDDSKPVEIFTRDIYPPAQPAGLQAVFSSVGQKPFIDLTWAPNLESDLAGYNVFRRSGDGSWEKLNPQLVPGPSFRDENVQPGKVYTYTVSAVDLRGNESPRSAEASETAAENDR